MAAQETRVPAWRRLGLALKNESQSGVAVPEPSTSHSDLQRISSIDGPDSSRANLQQPTDAAVNGKSSKLGKRKHQHEPADYHDQASKRGKKSSPSPASTGFPASDIAPVPQPDNGQTRTETNEATPIDTSKPKGDPNYRKKKTKSKKSKSRNHDEGEEKSATNGIADHGRPSLSPASPAPNAPVLLASTETDHGFAATASTPQKSSHFQKGLSDSPSGTERRKSVAFTPDTKKADGSSAQNLFKKWVAEQKGSLSETTVASEPKPQQRPIDSTQESKKHDKPKKDNKQATTSSAKEKSPSKAAEQSFATESETAPVPISKESEELKPAAAVGKKGKKKDPSIYLSYLAQYHTDRGNWKFNKAKQNDVLDNSLNIFRIPEEYTEALLEYVQGLQGAGVIERLRERCEVTLKELDTEEAKEQSAMDDSADRKAAHDEALQKRVKQEQKRRATDGDVEAVANHPHPENYIRRLRRTRAEALLAALARAAPILPITQTGRTNPLAHNLAPPTRDSQKRKRRVDVSSDDSSSDSSSEEESDSSESDESSESSESSSDDSSDSSSDEESDSDSDDE